MKHGIWIPTVIAISWVATAHGEGEETSPDASPTSPFTQTFDFAVGVGAHEFTSALSFNVSYGFGSSRALKVGLGARALSFFGGDNLGYTTGDSSLIGSNLVNTLSVSGAQTNSLNAAFSINYKPVAGLLLGLNIDLIGFGLGNSRAGNYAATDARFNGSQPATTSSFNLLLGGKGDHGQLDSEFYLGYQFNDNWIVRAGISHLSSEYTTAIKLDNGNDKYRHSTTLPFAAVSYSL